MLITLIIANKRIPYIDHLFSKNKPNPTIMLKSVLRILVPKKTPYTSQGSVDINGIATCNIDGIPSKANMKIIIPKILAIFNVFTPFVIFTNSDGLII